MDNNKGFFKSLKNKILVYYAIGGFLVSFGSNIAFSDLTDLVFGFGLGLLPFMILMLILSIFTFGLLILGPFLGRWIDRNYSLKGRRRIYILISGISMGFILLATAILTLTIGILDPTMKLIFLILIIGANYCGMFIFTLNYSSLFPEMFQEFEERTNVRTVVGFLIILGNLLGDIIPTNINVLPFFSSILVFIGSYLLLHHGIKEPYNKMLIRRKFDLTNHQEPSILKNPIFKTFLIFSIFVILASQFLNSGFPFYLSFTIMSYYGILTPELIDFIGALLIIGPQICSMLFLIYWRKICLNRGIKRGMKFILVFTLIIIIPCAISFDIFSGIILSLILEGVLNGISLFIFLFLAIIIDNYFINTMNRREASHIASYNLLNGIFEFIGLIIFQFISIFGALFGSFGDESLILIGYIPKVIAFIMGGILLLISLYFLKIIPLNNEEYEKIESRVMEINQSLKN